MDEHRFTIEDENGKKTEIVIEQEGPVLRLYATTSTGDEVEFANVDAMDGGLRVLAWPSVADEPTITKCEGFEEIAAEQKAEEDI